MKSEAIKEALKLVGTIAAIVAIGLLAILNRAIQINNQNERTREIIRQELDRAP